MSLDPLHQFQISEVGSLSLLGLADVAVTNQSLWMLAAIGTVLVLFLQGSRSMQMVPNRLQSFVELTYEFVENLIKGTAGHEAMAFMPLILSLFLFIAALNLSGMIPGSYTSTSQIAVTASLALSVFLLVWVVGFYKHGIEFLTLFCPAGTPVWLMPLVVPLEIISFFARPLTLSIRLMANMVAGHILLKVFASFAIMMVAGWGLAGVVGAVVPTVLLVAISGLEVFVALLQAYIFTVLTCVYLNDALHMH